MQCELATERTKSIDITSTCTTPTHTFKRLMHTIEECCLFVRSSSSTNSNSAYWQFTHPCIHLIHALYISFPHSHRLFHTPAVCIPPYIGSDFCVSIFCSFCFHVHTQDRAIERTFAHVETWHIQSIENANFRANERQAAASKQAGKYCQVDMLRSLLCMCTAKLVTVCEQTMMIQSLYMADILSHSFDSTRLTRLQTVSWTSLHNHL